MENAPENHGTLQGAMENTPENHDTLQSAMENEPETHSTLRSAMENAAEIHGTLQSSISTMPLLERPLVLHGPLNGQPKHRKSLNAGYSNGNGLSNLKSVYVTEHFKSSNTGGTAATGS